MREGPKTTASAQTEDPILAGLLASTPPRISAEAAAELLETRFGIRATAQEVACERDQNFHAITADGRGFALKISNPQEPAESTDFQIEALRWIERSDPTLPVPKMVPTRDGAYSCAIPLPDGRQSRARVLSWLDGTPLYKVARVPAFEREIGTVLARIGRALRAFRHPGAQHELLWDIRHTPRLRPLLEALPEDEMKPVLRAALDRYEQVIVPQLAGLRRQVVHNDMNHHNILVDPTRPDRISGVIDFGDMVETCLAIDVAVAASYLADAPTDPLAAVANMVAAYAAVTPLERAEIVLMRDLIVARLITSIIITGWRAQRYPANAGYILRNNGPARLAMSRFATRDPAEVTAALLRACNME